MCLVVVCVFLMLVIVVANVSFWAFTVAVVVRQYLDLNIPSTSVGSPHDGLVVSVPAVGNSGCWRYAISAGLNKMYSYIVIISSTNKYRKHKSNILIKNKISQRRKAQLLVARKQNNEVTYTLKLNFKNLLKTHGNRCAFIGASHARTHKI